MDSSEIPRYGLTALLASLEASPAPSTTHPETVPVRELRVPTTALAQRVDAYVREKLSPPTYAHSRRVYSYGLAIARQCYPNWEVTPGSALEETWFLAAMLHDIGTCDEFLESTRLSFEFWGGMHALRLLQDPTITSGAGSGVATRAQAESVCEAIIRHQDVQDKGSITLITRLAHLGTLLDNIGANSHLVS